MSKAAPALLINTLYAVKIPANSADIPRDGKMIVHPAAKPGEASDNSMTTINNISKNDRETGVPVIIAAEKDASINLTGEVGQSIAWLIGTQNDVKFSWI